MALVMTLVGRWWDGLLERPWWFAIALAVALLAVRRGHRLFHRLAVAALIGGGLAWAWSLAWASDDAFITFRYAENLVRGHGLVFNPGERVEGYTDFLWALVVATGVWAGAPAPQFALVVSLASFVALLLLVRRVSGTLGEPELFPFAVALSAANYTIASFATGGLETVFAAALVLLALERAGRGRPASASVAGVLAALSHPDHLLFWGALGLALVSTTRSLRDARRFAAPFVLLFLPYFAWRWHFYGDLFPNTYYAKSGDLPYWSQGVKYVLVSAVGSGALLLAPLVVLGAWRTRATLFGRFCLLGLPLYLAYVARIGGDFMLGRLLTTAFPLLFLLAEAGLRELVTRRRRWWALGLAALGSLALTPVRVVGPGELFEGVADERTFTPLVRFSPLEIDAGGFRLGRHLRETFTARGLSPRLAIFSLGMASFGTELPVFDLRGLTSRSVAHQPIFERGRPGHEKVATVGQVLEAQVDLSMIPLAPPPFDALGRVELAGAPFWLTHYRPALVAPLRALGLADFPAWLDAQRWTQDRPALDCAVWHAWRYYFSENEDAARRARILSSLAPDVAADAALVLEPPATRGWKARRTFGFDDSTGWTVEGSAGTWFTAQPPPRQTVPFGQRGRFLDSFTAQGDDAVGVLSSAPFVLEGDALTLLVGGGADVSTRVELLVDDVPVRVARGCQSEWLGERAWDVRAWRGRTARLRIVDEARGGWGHLLVDEVVEWAP